MNDERAKNDLPKNRPVVPVHVSAVPIQVSLCHFAQPVSVQV